MLIVPLVFFSLVSGISSLSSLTSLGNITFKTISLYLGTTAIAVSISLLVASIFKPGAGYSSNISAPEKLPEGQSVYLTILDIFPSNIIEAITSSGLSSSSVSVSTSTSLVSNSFPKSKHEIPISKLQSAPKVT